MRSILEIAIIVYLSLFAFGTFISQRKKFENRNGLFNLKEIIIYAVSVIVVFVIVMALPLRFTDDGFLIDETIYIIPLLIALIATGYVAVNFTSERKLKKKEIKKVSTKKEKSI